MLLSLRKKTFLRQIGAIKINVKSKITGRQFLCAAILILASARSYAETSTEIPRTANNDNAEILESSYDFYSDNQNRYGTSKPTGWDTSFLSPPTDGTVFIKQPSTSDGKTAAIGIVVTPPSNNITEVVDAAEDYFQKQPGIERVTVNHHQNISLSGTTGVDRTVTITPINNGAELYVRTLYLQHPNYTFALSLTTSLDDAVGFTPQFEKMIQDFTIL